MSGSTQASPTPGEPPVQRSGRHRLPIGWLSRLLPAGVVVVDALDAPFVGNRWPDAPELFRRSAFDAELEALGEAPPMRRQEFARARICAHAAVASLGRPPVPILLGRHREPRWPVGLVGSITHCPGYRAAAAADTATVLALGIDAEADRRLPAEVGRLVLTENDRAASGPLGPGRNWEAVAFSARESVFKAWYAVTGRWLGFPDASLSLHPQGPLGGVFAACIGSEVAGVGELVRACGTTELTGSFGWAPNLVLTAVTLRHRGTGDASTGGGDPGPRP